jgi:mRNA interferase MazF
LDKRRPVVLLSRNEAYAVRAMVIVAPVSTTIRGFSVEVKVGKHEGLPRAGVVNCDWLVTVPKTDLVSRVGVLSSAKAQALDDALRFALALDQ